jgi:hypothetical protein
MAMVAALAVEAVVVACEVVVIVVQQHYPQPKAICNTFKINVFVFCLLQMHNEGLFPSKFTSSYAREWAVAG